MSPSIRWWSPDGTLLDNPAASGVPLVGCRAAKGRLGAARWEEDEARYTALEDQGLAWVILQAAPADLEITPEDRQEWLRDHLEPRRWDLRTDKGWVEASADDTLIPDETLVGMVVGERRSLRGVEGYRWNAEKNGWRRDHALEAEWYLAMGGTVRPNPPVPEVGDVEDLLHDTDLPSTLPTFDGWDAVPVSGVPVAESAPAAPVATPTPEDTPPAPEAGDEALEEMDEPAEGIYHEFGPPPEAMDDIIEVLEEDGGPPVDISTPLTEVLPEAPHAPKGAPAVPTEAGGGGVAVDDVPYDEPPDWGDDDSAPPGWGEDTPEPMAPERGGRGDGRRDAPLRPRGGRLRDDMDEAAGPRRASREDRDADQMHLFGIKSGDGPRVAFRTTDGDELGIDWDSWEANGDAGRRWALRHLILAKMGAATRMTEGAVMRIGLHFADILPLTTKQLREIAKQVPEEVRRGTRVLIGPSGAKVWALRTGDGKAVAVTDEGTPVTNPHLLSLVRRGLGAEEAPEVDRAIPTRDR